MLFNSIEYLLFLPVVFAVYWVIGSRHRKVQNVFILVASYIFYGWWSWKFLGLLLLSTVLDFAYAFGVASENKNRSKIFLWLSIVNNLGILAIFKYYNFFIEQVAQALNTAGISFEPIYLSVLLPVGISFYTFHGMSYVFDVYRKKLTPVSNLVDYGVFVSFFPLLVAGPIERASHLLPQIQNPRIFSYGQSVIGLRLILWGIFKKVVIADTSAHFANEIFNNPAQYNGITLLLGGLFFSLQIYGDFSGYSDIALGSARLLGFDLLKNFRFPYFSRDLAEFWKRWHISLTGWFRDYLYIPLGGSKEGKGKTVRNTFIVFLVSGLWHGASWNFIVWGLAHAIGFLPLLLLNKTKTNTSDSIAANSLLPSWPEWRGMLLTFLYVMLCWIIFRAPDLATSWYMISGIFSFDLFHLPNLNLDNSEKLMIFHLSISTLVLITAEWVSRRSEYSITFFDLVRKPVLRWSSYLALVMMIVYFKGNPVQFIYFAF
jgi:D-alanyl-lipoteichoic acid acyltransferase DltB (MBOAT superfamily)